MYYTTQKSGNSIRRESAAQNMPEESNQSISDVELVDDFYFPALSNENEDQMLPISDSKYAQELQLQEALMSSVTNASQTPLTIQSGQSSTQDTSIVDIPEQKELCESSLSFCEICVERKEADEMFRIDGCSHSFCSECVTKHVTTKIQENQTVISCPSWDCGGALELDSCRAKMSGEVIDRWGEILCLSLIPESEKFYCPFKDCSAMMINDGGGDQGVEIRESECPVCHRLFCAECYVPWHAGIGCEEFRRLNEEERGREDLMLRELARSKSWMRCPHCKFYVERTEGCLHMVCRCRLEFCYSCGAPWSDTHGGCQRP